MTVPTLLKVSFYSICSYFIRHDGSELFKSFLLTELLRLVGYASRKHPRYGSGYMLQCSLPVETRRISYVCRRDPTKVIESIEVGSSKSYSLDSTATNTSLMDIAVSVAYLLVIFGLFVAVPGDLSGDGCLIIINCRKRCWRPLLVFGSRRL